MDQRSHRHEPKLTIVVKTRGNSVQDHSSRLMFGLQTLFSSAGIAGACIMPRVALQKNSKLETQQQESALSLGHRTNLRSAFGHNREQSICGYQLSSSRSHGGDSCVVALFLFSLGLCSIHEARLEANTARDLRWRPLALGGPPEH